MDTKLHMINSMKIECLLEFQNIETKDGWKAIL